MTDADALKELDNAHFTEEEYAKLPGNGAAELLNGLCGEMVLKFSKAVSAKGTRLLCFHAKNEQGQMFYAYQPFIAV